MDQKRSLGYTRVQSLAHRILNLLGWKVEFNYPDAESYVLIGAPHTSSWDFVYAMLFIYASGTKINWIAKDSLFRWPFRSLLRRIGGIPVNRRSRQDFVSKIVAVFHENKKLVVAIAPEGTRSKCYYWKTGFYYMAMGANVPVVMGFFDYQKKIVGMGPNFYPSGDIQSDFEQIKAFYASIKGKHPQKQGTIQLRAEN